MLTITPQQLTTVQRHLQQCYPNEGCGFLFGVVDNGARRVREVKPASNRRNTGAGRRYLIDPDTIRSAGREAETEGFEIIGFYHSHPDVAPVPSEYDREHAWPWYSYLIVSVQRGHCRELRSWRLRDDRSGFDPEALEVNQEECDVR